MKKILILALLLSISSCVQDSNEEEQEISAGEESLEQPLDINREAKVNLLPRAEGEIMQWTAFANARVAIEQIENYNLKELKANTEPLAEIILEMKSTLPSGYRIPSIEARINVLFTKAMVLNQKLNGRNVEISEINREASELVSEFEYLKIQLNELFLQSPEDFEIDLEEIREREEEFEREKERVEQQNDSLNMERNPAPQSILEITPEEIAD